MLFTKLLGEYLFAGTRYFDLINQTAKYIANPLLKLKRNDAMISASLLSEFGRANMKREDKNLVLSILKYALESGRLPDQFSLMLKNRTIPPAYFFEQSLKHPSLQYVGSVETSAPYRKDANIEVATEKTNVQARSIDELNLFLGKGLKLKASQDSNSLVAWSSWGLSLLNSSDLRVHRSISHKDLNRFRPDLFTRTDRKIFFINDAEIVNSQKVILSVVVRPSMFSTSRNLFEMSDNYVLILWNPLKDISSEGALKVFSQKVFLNDPRNIATLVEQNKFGEELICTSTYQRFIQILTEHRAGKDKPISFKTFAKDRVFTPMSSCYDLSISPGRVELPNMYGFAMHSVSADQHYAAGISKSPTGELYLQIKDLVLNKTVYNESFSDLGYQQPQDFLVGGLVGFKGFSSKFILITYRDGKSFLQTIDLDHELPQRKDQLQMKAGSIDLHKYWGLLPNLQSRVISRGLFADKIYLHISSVEDGRSKELFRLSKSGKIQGVVISPDASVFYVLTSEYLYKIPRSSFLEIE